MYYKTFLVTFIWLISNVVGQCPTEVPIKSPCTYESYQTHCYIICDDNESFDIKAIFTDLSRRLPADRKLFWKLYLFNKALKELPANAFAGIQFGSIIIDNAIHLQRINVAAFDGTAQTVTDLSISDSPVSESVTNDSDLFGAINTLKSLETLLLSNTGVQSLPSLSLSNLRKLQGIGVDENPLRSISANAFNELPALKIIQFYAWSSIERVSEHAFTVGHNSTDQSLEIKFESQLIDPFDSRAFESIGCATAIKLGNNSMKYLDFNEFNVFLSENPMNRVFDESIDCADSRNQWIHEKYPKVWHDLKCA